MPGKNPFTGFYTMNGLEVWKRKFLPKSKYLIAGAQACAFGKRKIETVALGGTIFTASATACVAATNQSVTSSLIPQLWHSPGSTGILMLAVFGGAMSFALLSASWLIRERTRTISENHSLKSSLSKLRATSDRNEALVSVNEQRVVVWNGKDETPTILGTLSEGTGAPRKHSDFCAFGGWLESKSAQTFEISLNELKDQASPFDMVIKTKSGTLLEAEGRTSGSYAFVRFREISAERKAHAKLTLEHEQVVSNFGLVESLFEFIEMPVWIADPDGRLSWANQAYAKALEKESPAEVVAQNENLFDQEQRREIEQVLGGGKPFSGELPAIYAGDRRQLAVTAVRTDAGVAGIASDRSDLEMVRNTLEETIESHSRMLDHLATAVAIFDGSQQLTFYNSGFQQLWGLDNAFLDTKPGNRELFDAMRDQKLLPERPDWRKWCESQLEIYTGLEPVEEWWHLLDGQTIRVVSSPRQQGGATWIFENVTERLALESNYNSLMRIQGETLDHLNEAVAVFGSDGKLRLFNPALEQLWDAVDLQVEEGLHITKIIEVWSEAIANAQDLEAILGKVTGLDDERSETTGRLNLADGLTLEYGLVPLPKGQSMLTLTDITANVNFEKALRDRAEALEESDQLKSKFIQHVSYELRAPLTSISGFGEMLMTSEVGGLNEKQAEYLAHINSSAEELKAIVDDILDLASIDAGAMVLDIKKIEIKSLVEKTIIAVSPDSLEKEVSFNVDIDANSRSVMADEDRLGQVLFNLFANAVAFSPDGGSISVTFKPVENGCDLIVSDDGPGVPPDEMDAIFDRFETRPVDGARQGAGLGLSIVKSLMQLHGGSVRVEPAGEKGASFVCSFPQSPAGESGDEDRVAAA